MFHISTIGLARCAGLLLATTALTGVATVSLNSPARAEQAAPQAFRFDLPAQPLAAAISGIGATSGWRIAYGGGLPDTVRSSAVSGTMTVPEAVSRALAGTGLTYRVTGTRSIILETPASATGAATALDTITVEGTATATTEGSDSYAASAVTVAGKIPVAVREVPNSVSVVTNAQMRDQNLDSVQDVLAQTTGVTAVSYGDGSAYFSARGYQLNVQYDGISANSGIQYLPQFDTSIYDRAEVLRGPAGLLGGSGEPAGTVNLVRKMPLDHYALSTETQIGSWDFLRQSIDLSSPLNSDGTIRGRLILTGENRQFFYDDAKEWHGTAYGALQFDLDAQTTLSLSAAFQRQDLAPFDYGQSLYSNLKVLDAPRNGFYGADWSYSNTDTSEVYANLTHDFDNGLKWNTTAFVRNMQSDSAYAYMYDGVDPITNMSDYAVQSGAVKLGWGGLDTNLTGSFDFFGRQSQFLIGADYNRSFKRQGGGFVDAGYYDIFTAHSQVPELAAPFGWNSETRVTEGGLYGQTRLALADPLTLVLGSRLSWYSSQTRSVLDGPTSWSTEPGVNAKLTPYAGLVYDLNEIYTLYASYSSIFTPQSDDTTASGQGIQPRVGRQYEAGLKFDLADTGLTGSLAAFDIKDNHRAVTDEANPDYYLDAGKARSRGVEAEVSGKLAPNWDIMAGYAYLDTRYLDDPDYQGQSLDTEEPRNSLKLWTKYSFDKGSLDGLSLGGGMRYVGGTSRGSAPAVSSQGGYTVFDAQIGYQFANNLQATLTVTNLFDKTYFDRLPTAYFGIYGEPRAVMLTVTKHW